jgi:hypothetical protein
MDYTPAKIHMETIVRIKGVRRFRMSPRFEPNVCKIRSGRTKKVRTADGSTYNSLIPKVIRPWHSECIETEAQTLPEDL